MAVANQFGIDLPGIVQSGNALLASRQQQQMNALFIQNAQRENAVQNAFTANAPALYGVDPDARQNALLSVARAGASPDTIVQFQTHIASLDDARRKSLRDNLELGGQLAGSVANTPDDELPDAVLADVIPVAGKAGLPFTQKLGVMAALARQSGDITQLKSTLRQIQTVGLTGAQQIDQFNKDREFAEAQRKSATDAANKPFNADGTPNKAYQDYELKKATAPAEARSQVLNVQFDPATIDFLADQALAGDKSVFAQLGYGNTGQMNRVALRNAITKKAAQRGITGPQLAALNAEFTGLTAGERTLGNRTANIEMAASELQQLTPLAVSASAAVPRTRFPTLNSVLLAAEQGTGDENVVRLSQAVNALVNIYARAISPTGTPTVSDKDHAREILDKAWANNQFDAAIDQMGKEIAAGRQAPAIVRGEFRSAISGGQPGSVNVPDAPLSAPGKTSGRFRIEQVSP